MNWTIFKTTCHWSSTTFPKLILSSSSWRMLNISLENSEFSKSLYTSADYSCPNRNQPSKATSRLPSQWPRGTYNQHCWGLSMSFSDSLSTTDCHQMCWCSMPTSLMSCWAVILRKLGDYSTKPLEIYQFYTPVTQMVSSCSSGSSW